MNKLLQKFHALDTEEQHKAMAVAAAIVITGALFVVLQLVYG